MVGYGTKWWVVYWWYIALFWFFYRCLLHKFVLVWVFGAVFSVDREAVFDLVYGCVGSELR